MEGMAFIIYKGSVEKSRQRRSLPSPERLRAGRSPFFREKYQVMMSLWKYSGSFQ
jgi:hypothetical protein